MSRVEREGTPLRLKILVVDVGGTHIKVLATGHSAKRQVNSGPTLTPRRMVQEVRRLTADWEYDVVSLGFPGPVMRGRIVAEPHNLGRGWKGFDFARAFGRPIKLINDAAMQALGSYRGGQMLFAGIGTGLGTTLIVDAGAPALPRPANLRGRRRVARLAASRQEEMAPPRAGRRGPAVRRRPRRRDGVGRGQRAAAEGPSGRGSRRRQRRRVQGRVPPVGAIGRRSARAHDAQRGRDARRAREAQCWCGSSSPASIAIGRRFCSGGSGQVA
jgi:ROK family